MAVGQAAHCGKRQGGRMIAALFVERDGCYSALRNVDVWDSERDARNYRGPWPVVAHPPCERWGRYAGPGRGRDEGCFAAALAAVRDYGGILEHPADSHAWQHFGLAAPPRCGGWIDADGLGATCCVEQGWYGHRARKRTWLYSCRVHLPPLRWGRCPGDFVYARPGRDPAREIKTGACQRMSHRQRAATPPQFRNLLISIAEDRFRK